MRVQLVWRRWRALSTAIWRSRCARSAARRFAPPDRLRRGSARRRPRRPRARPRQGTDGPIVAILGLRYSASEKPSARTASVDSRTRRSPVDSCCSACSASCTRRSARGRAPPARRLRAPPASSFSRARHARVVSRRVVAAGARLSWRSRSPARRRATAQLRAGAIAFLDLRPQLPRRALAPRFSSSTRSRSASASAAWRAVARAARAAAGNTSRPR